MNKRYKKIMRMVQLYLKAYDKRESAWDFESHEYPNLKNLAERANTELKLVKAYIKLRDTFKELNKKDVTAALYGERSHPKTFSNLQRDLEEREIFNG